MLIPLERAINGPSVCFQVNVAVSGAVDPAPLAPTPGPFPNAGGGVSDHGTASVTLSLQLGEGGEGRMGQGVGA